MVWGLPGYITELCNSLGTIPPVPNTHLHERLIPAKQDMGSGQKQGVKLIPVEQDVVSKRTNPV